MRLLVLFCLSGLVNTSLALATRRLTFHQFGLSAGDRHDLPDGLGLLQGLEGSTLSTQTTSTATATASSPTTFFVPSLFSESTSSRKKTVASDSTTDTITYASQTALSVYATSAPASHSTTSTISPSVSPTFTQVSNSTAASSTSEWKIIGVAVIAFSAVAAVLLLAVFFDQWSRFVRHLLWRKRKKEIEEELVPDWERAEWELRLAKDPELARYPSFTSLPSSMPSVPVVPMLQRLPSTSPSQALTPPIPSQVALGRSASRREAQAKALERGRGEQQDQRLARRTSVSRHQHPGSNAGIAGVGVGLGLGRIDSVKTPKTDASLLSPPTRTDVWKTSSPRASPQPGRAQAVKEGKPSGDTHSTVSMPEDIYGGIE